MIKKYRVCKQTYIELIYIKMNEKSKKINTEEEALEDTLVKRKPVAVAQRILGLFAVVGKVNFGDNPKFIDWFEKYNIAEYLSDKETEFVKSDAPSEKAIRNFSWRSEALTSLLWGVNVIDEMPVLNESFNVYAVNEIGTILNNSNEFIKNIELRSEKELDEMENNLYNAHWTVRDAQLNGKKLAEELNPSIVYERRYGLSWLVGWGDNWDEVPTDT